MDAELGETDAAAAAQQTPIHTEVWVDQRSGMANPAALTIRIQVLGLLEESVPMAQPIQWATLTPREKVVARGVATALRALIGGKALSCIRHHPEKLYGF